MVLFIFPIFLFHIHTLFAPTGERFGDWFARVGLEGAHAAFEQAKAAHV